MRKTIFLDRITTFLIVILAFVVFLVLVVALVMSFGWDYISKDWSIFQLEPCLFPTVVTSSGVLIAILSFTRERKKQELESKRHMSGVFLERVKDGFNTTIQLLSDQNNDRVTWIRAARTLLKSLELKKQITSEEDKLEYELEEERTRNELYKVVSLVDEETGERRPLPPQFFYGIDNWRTCKSLDEAAKQASFKIKAYILTIDEVPLWSQNTALSAESVIAIFDFVKFSATYKDKDPLRTVSLEGRDNWQDCFQEEAEGACRYVAHTIEKYALDGRLYDRPK